MLLKTSQYSRNKHLKDHIDCRLINNLRPKEVFDQICNDEYVKQHFPQYYDNIEKFIKEKIDCKSLSSGHSKLIFYDADNIYKLYKTKKAYTQEYVHYRLIQERLQLDILASTTWHEYYAVQEFCAPIDYSPENIKKYLIDNGPRNFGIVNDKEVILDFENINRDSLGLSIVDYNKIFYALV